MRQVDRQTIAAVVVTYNRKELLNECLQALLHQTRPLDRIIIIDNASTDGTPGLLAEKGYLLNPVINYVRLRENTGGAGGFYEGIKKGHEAGYDWLWLMDDDAEPMPDALEKLQLESWPPEVAALANLVISSNGEIQLHHRGYTTFSGISKNIVIPITLSILDQRPNIEISFCSFVGFIIRKSTISQIGYPAKDFFIHYDDNDYSIRVSRVGKIILVVPSVVKHKDAAKSSVVRKKFLGRDSDRVQFEKLWLQYYGIRNKTYLIKHYHPNQLIALLGILVEELRRLTGILLYDDYKLKRIRFFISARVDGYLGRFDNKKPKRLLYT